MAVIGYIRVSIDRQTYKHQRFEIEEYAKNQDLKIDDWIIDIPRFTGGYLF